LFSLETGTAVEERVGFHNTGPGQIPGLIVMSIDDTVGVDLDADADAVWALFNAGDEARDFPIASLSGTEVVLHPVQASSSDPVVRTSSFDEATGTFTVPARTTAVFVQLPPDTTPPEVAAELVPGNVSNRVGWFTVLYSCVDDRDPDPMATATLNGIPIENGTEVLLITHPVRSDWKWQADRLTVWGSEFVLEVTCTDASGNTTIERVVPEFRAHPPR
jgi:hypothetical protein